MSYRLALRILIAVFYLSCWTVCPALTQQSPDSSSQQAPTNGQSQGTPSPSTTPASAPTPLSTPSITGPLQAATPITFDAGPFGKLALNVSIRARTYFRARIQGDELEA